MPCINMTNTMTEKTQDKKSTKPNGGRIKIHMLKNGFYADPKEILAGENAQKQIKQLREMYGPGGEEGSVQIFVCGDQLAGQ